MEPEKLKELDEILYQLRYGTSLLKEAHSAILKWIEKRLPKERKIPKEYSMWVDHNEPGYTNGWNAYRQQALKSLGITPNLTKK